MQAENLPVEMTLDNVKDGHLGLSSREQLLDDMSSEEPTSSNHQVRFALGHFGVGASFGDVVWERALLVVVCIGDGRARGRV